MRGPSLVQWHLLRRGLVTWLGARALFALALLMTMNPPLANGGVVALGVLGLTIALGVVETRRVEERVLLANLGLGFATLPSLLATAAIIGETLLGLLLP